jgi:hypothetical protein
MSLTYWQLNFQITTPSSLEQIHVTYLRSKNPHMNICHCLIQPLTATVADIISFICWCRFIQIYFLHHTFNSLISCILLSTESWLVYPGLLGCDAVSLRARFQTFWRIVVSSSSTVKQSKNSYSSWTVWPLKIKTLWSFKMSGTTHPMTVSHPRRLESSATLL